MATRILVRTKSGREIDIGVWEEAKGKSAKDAATEFFDAASLSTATVIRYGPHIFFVREIESITFE